VGSFAQWNDQIDRLSIGVSGARVQSFFLVSFPVIEVAMLASVLRGAVMFREQARGFVAALMLVFTVLGMAQSAEEVRLIQVDPGAFNAYGHWLGEGGKLELRCSGGRTFADGWQISPTLQFLDLPAPLPESMSPKRTLVLAVCSYRDSMYAVGDPAESVVAACKARLRSSGLVDLEAVATDGDKVEGGISHDGGPNYRVYWLGKAPGVMKLGGPEVPPTQAMINAVQESEAQAVLAAMARVLENGGMVIVSAYPLPRVKFVPAGRKTEALDLLRQAAQASAPITEQSWPMNDLIDYGFAEQMRRPLPVGRREGG
jgi:hypothetical protein